MFSVDAKWWCNDLGPVVQNPINDNPRLTKEFISQLQGVVQRWYSAKLYIRRNQSWKKIKQKKFSAKSLKHETKAWVYANPELN